MSAPVLPAAAPSRPELSHLLQTPEGRRLYRRAVVAMIRGWQVRGTTDEDTPIYAPGEVVGLPPDWRERADSWSEVFAGPEYEGEGPAEDPDSVDWEWLPDPELDPAAAWDLMVRERITLSAPDHDASPDAVWIALDPSSGMVGADAKPAAALVRAVLHKYADGPHADLICPLLALEERDRA